MLSTAPLVPGHRVWLLSPSRLSDHRTVESLAEPAWHALGIEQPNPIGDRRPNPCEHALGGMQRDATTPHADGQFGRRFGWWQPTTTCRFHDDRAGGRRGSPYRRSAHTGGGDREMHTPGGSVFVSKPTAAVSFAWPSPVGVLPVVTGVVSALLAVSDETNRRFYAPGHAKCRSPHGIRPPAVRKMGEINCDRFQ